MKNYVSFALAITLVLGTIASSTFSQHGEINKIPHGINPNANSPNFPGFAVTTGGTRKTTALNYYGGPLIPNPVIYIVWYGNWNQSNGSDNSTAQQLVRDWANSIGGTPYFQLNQSLSVSGYPISGNVSFGGDTSDAYSRGTALTDGNIQSIVDSAISNGKLPYNASGVYFVVTSSDVNETSGFCTQYCGWHTYGNITGGQHVRFAFVGNAKRCLTACAEQSVSPNNNPGVDGAISVLSHELEEATTDPDINAWLDSRGAENADKCAWTFGHAQFQLSNGSWANMTFGGHNWLIQRNILKTASGFFCMVNSSQN